jgi:2-methylisocitrate lyase-like PEP mutase family enzyme
VKNYHIYCLSISSRLDFVKINLIKNLTICTACVTFTKGGFRVSKSLRLLELIHSPKLLVMPAAYDAISAKIIEEVGYTAIQCSGLGICAAAGVPDFSILSLREMVERSKSIARVVTVPVMGDADTGYGNAVNVWYTVKEFEDAGLAGINLEDQVFPKRCGRVAGKEIIPISEMTSKIEAAVNARRDQHFVINARTDALSLFGLQEAIKRGNSYMKAGASMIFVTGVKGLEQMRELTAGISGPVAINLMEQDSSCGDFSFQDIQEAGIARVSLTSSTMLSAIHGMRSALEKIKSWDGTRLDSETFCPLQDLQDIAGMPEALALEKRFIHRN